MDVSLVSLILLIVIKTLLLICLFGLVFAKAEACPDYDVPPSELEVNLIREKVLESSNELTDFIQPTVSPLVRFEFEMEEELRALQTEAQVTFGCLEGKRIVGYYSALKHIWLFVELSSDGAVEHAELSIGWPVSEENGGWWPELIETATTVKDAIYSAQYIQINYFFGMLNNTTAANLASVGGFSSKQAVSRLNDFYSEHQRLDQRLSQAFEDELSRRLSNSLDLWDARYALVRDKEWNVFLTSAKAPGSIIVGQWKLNTSDGFVYYKDHTLITSPALDQLYASQGND